MEGEAVQVDGIRPACQTCDIGVPGQHPFRALFDFHIDTACRPVAVDGTCKDGIVLEIQIQFGDFIHDHIAVDLLIRRSHIHMTSVGTFAAPAGSCRSEKDAAAIVDDFRVSQVNGCRRVVDKENISVGIGEPAALHGKGRSPFISVAGHGLVDHDRLIVVGLVAVFGIVVCCQFHVVEGDRVLSLHNDALGRGRLHHRIVDSDIGCGINDRRACSAGCIGSAGHGDCTAAAVGTNGRGGIAAGMDGQILRVHGTAACGHESAGAVAAGLNIGI